MDLKIKVGMSLTITLFLFGCSTLLVDRKWNAPPVILEYYEAPGGQGTIDQSVPLLVLYANGDIYIKKYEDDFRYSIYKATLKDREMCDFLLKIESFGFFKDSAKEFSEPEVFDASTTYITIRAWKNQDIDMYGLWPEEVPVNPSLADTYYFLNNYTPLNSKKYMPDTIDLDISIEQPWDENGVVREWRFDEVSLAEVVAKGLYPDYEQIRLKGEIAKKISAFLGSSWIGYVKENRITYLIRVVPLLPLQIKTERIEDGLWFGVTDPYSYPQTPITEIDCN